MKKVLSVILGIPGLLVLFYALGELFSGRDWIVALVLAVVMLALGGLLWKKADKGTDTTDRSNWRGWI